MRIVLGTCSSNPDFNADCDCALVNLTPAYAGQILERMQGVSSLAKNNASLHEAHYWDGDAAYFQATFDDDLDEMLIEARDTYVVLDDKVELPEEAFKRVEYTHMVVSVMGDELEVFWRATPKGASLYIRTNPLPKSLIESAAQ
ncbi:MAG TPA: hypothetical protein VHC22_02040 [Pirellulales bacterium]|nr:hypothetical protein [Pirellulales bacterium]